MQQHIVQKIINSKEELDTKKKLQSFLGLVNQVRECIPKLAETLKPLQKKLKKGCRILQFPDENRKFIYIVEADDSEYSYGGLLKYRYEAEKIEHHCRYYSGTFNETEIKWEINRKVLCSLYKCLLAFEPYIVYNKFIVRTDNTQVRWWLTKKIQNSVTTKEIRRLFLNILNFTFTIEVISTNKNVIADYISRQRYTN